MAEVKKRVKKAESFEPLELLTREDEDVTISAKGKEYLVPVLTLRQYKKVLKMLDNADFENMTEIESLDFTKDFYYNLLKSENPELKKTDMEDMPLYQLGATFVAKVKLALFKVPLGS